MNGPMSYQRTVVVDHTVKVDGVALDLYPAPRGAGWWTPASPIFAVASIPDAEHLDFLRQHGITNVLHGYEGAYDPMLPEHRRHVALISPNVVSGILLNARAQIDPATVAAIETAMRA